MAYPINNMASVLVDQPLTLLTACVIWLLVKHVVAIS